MENRGCMNCGSVYSQTLPLAKSEDVGNDKNHLTVKVPVVLAEKDIQIDVESCVDFKEPFYEIKRVKKNVVLNQCKLVVGAGETDKCTGQKRSGKLFLSGYVEKNYEYATVDCGSEDIITGDIKHTTVRVPFNVVTEVFYDRPPQFSYRVNTRELDSFFEREHSCEEEFIGKNPCETEYEEKINFIERPHCELESARIYDADIFREEKYQHGEKVYGKVVEKMVVYLRIKVLQLQQIRIL